jgi:putative FmdB family regulatory protein
MYECVNCEKEVEVLQKISDEAPVCEFCQDVMKKKISTSNFQLIGGGWFKDLYSSGKQKQTKKS